jgi:hypothetical protein
LRKNGLLTIVVYNAGCIVLGLAEALTPEG